MPHRPKIAVEILELFKKQDSRVGYVIPTAVVLTWFARQGWSLTEAEQGIEYGLAKGWFENSFHEFVGLRSAGFDEIERAASPRVDGRCGDQERLTATLF